MRRRWIRPALLVVLALALVAGGGAFSSVEADRLASVSVVDDESAYLGLSEYRSVATADEEVELDRAEAGQNNTIATSGSVGTVFEVTNQFARELTAVRASATADHPDLTVTVEDGHTPASLAVGEQGEIAARIECDSVVRDAPVRFTVSVTGDGVEASRLDKTVRITCLPAGHDGSLSVLSTPTPTETATPTSTETAASESTPTESPTSTPAGT